MHACRAARPYCQPYRKPSDQWLPAPFHSSTVSPIVSLSNHQGDSRTSGQVSGVHIITVTITVDHSLDRRCGYEHSGCGDRHRGRGPQRRVTRASGSTAAILRRRRTAQCRRSAQPHRPVACPDPGQAPIEARRGFDTFSHQRPLVGSDLPFSVTRTAAPPFRRPMRLYADATLRKARNRTRRRLRRRC